MTTRLLYLTPGCFDKGGISRYSRYQITALRSLLGSENVRVLSLGGPDNDAIETPFDVFWHGKSNIRALRNLDRVNFAIKAALQAMSWRPSIVVSAHVNFTPLVRHIAAVAGAKSVLNVYGLEVWSGLGNSRRSGIKAMTVVISDCHFTARYIVSEGLRPELPEVIWDPVDLSHFAPEDKNHEIIKKYNIPDPSKHLIVMSLGRLTKTAVHKGFDRLIRNFAAITNEVPSARLVIGGRGDDMPRLQSLAAERGVRDRVVFAGSVDEADLPAFYGLADVFSLVSDRGHGRGEGIPLTPIEAMACGVPIIVGDEDGSEEAVVNGRNGFVISPRDPAAHQRALKALLCDSHLRSLKGTEARSVAEECFDFGEFTRKHRQLVKRLVEPQQPSWAAG